MPKKGAVKGGFDRTYLFQQGEKGFNKLFSELYFYFCGVNHKSIKYGISKCYLPSLI